MTTFSDSYVLRVLFGGHDGGARRWRRVRSYLFDPYRPELHYMRGPGPKWRAKHERTLRLGPVIDIVREAINRMAQLHEGRSVPHAGHRPVCHRSPLHLTDKVQGRHIVLRASLGSGSRATSLGRGAPEPPTAARKRSLRANMIFSEFLPRTPIAR